MHAKQAKATVAEIAWIVGAHVSKVRSDLAKGLFDMDDFKSVCLYVAGKVLLNGATKGPKGGEV